MSSYETIRYEVSGGVARDLCGHQGRHGVLVKAALARRIRRSAPRHRVLWAPSSARNSRVQAANSRQIPSGLSPKRANNRATSRPIWHYAALRGARRRETRRHAGPFGRKDARIGDPAGQLQTEIFGLEPVSPASGQGPYSASGRRRSEEQPDGNDLPKSGLRPTEPVQLAQPGFIRDGTWGVSVRRIESEEPSTRRKSGHEPAPFGTTWHYVAQDRPLHVVVGGCAVSSEGVCILGFRPDLHRVQPWRPGSKRGKTRRPRGAQEGNEAACRARAAARAAPPFR